MPEQDNTRRIMWPQVLAPIFAIALGGMGTVLWHILNQVNVNSNLRIEFIQHVKEMEVLQGTVTELDASMHADKAEMRELRTKLDNLVREVDAGTDDRFRGSDFLREKELFSEQINALRAGCKLRYETLDTRLLPIEQHFWSEHWGKHEKPDHD